MTGRISSELVSVILPTYNRMAWLPASVRSVQAQHGVNWELLLIDDGSTDGTTDWVRSLADSRIRCVPLGHSGNIPTVYNAGLDAARGEWIAFTNSDDLWPADKLTRQVERLRQCPDADWCYSDYRIINEQDEPVTRPHGGAWHARNGWIAEPILRRETVVAIQTLLVKASLARELRFDPATHLTEDYDFALRLAARAQGCAVNEPLAGIRQHAARTTTLTGGFTSHVSKAVTFRKAMISMPTPELRELARVRYQEHLRAFVRMGLRRAAIGDVVRAWLVLQRASSLVRASASPPSPG